MNENLIGSSTFDNVWNSLWHHAEMDMSVKIKKFPLSLSECIYLMQSMIGQTDKHNVQPVQSSVT